MTDVIKMYEQKQTSDSYTSLFPGYAPPHIPNPAKDPPSSKPTQAVHHPSCPPSQYQYHQLPCQAHICPCYVKNSCYCEAMDQNAGKLVKQQEAQIKLLMNAINKLQGEVVDIVNNVEKLATSKGSSMDQNTRSSKPTPSYSNPHNIPAYDNLETVIDVEVLPSDDVQNDSIVSVDEFVPDILLHPLPTDCLPTNQPSLNYQGKTNQQS